MAKGQQICHTGIRQPMHGFLRQFLECENVHLVPLQVAEDDRRVDRASLNPSWATFWL
jgi:hypothetical protein